MNETREKLSATKMEATIGYVRDIVAMFRRRGLKTEYAIPEVAGLLDLSPKRVKTIFYRDGLWGMAQDEAERIERRFADHLDAEIALSIEYTEQLRIKRNQISMGLTCEQENLAPRGFGSASTGSLVRSAA